MSVESSILEIQNLLNGKQAKVSELVLDKLVVHQKINFDNVSINNLDVGTINVRNSIHTPNITVTGNSTFGGNVTINSGLVVNGSSSFNGSTSVPNISIGELRDVSIRGWLRVESSITAGGNIDANKVYKAVWN